MNRLILTGRLTRDPEIRYTSKGESQETYAIARFTLACNHIGKSRDHESKADFITCVAFRKTAELVERYVRKGSLVLVTAAVHNNNYTDKNGDTVYSYNFVVDTIEFLDKKKEAGSEEGFMELPDDEEMPFC